MRIEKFFFYLTLIVLGGAPVLSSSQTIEWTVKVKEGKDYASFTTLEYYRGYFYCAFREANIHVDYNGVDNGVITIMRSKNGRAWKDYDQISLNGFDLRDPKLSITPNSRFMLIAEAVKYKQRKDITRKTMVSFMNHSKFGALKEIIFNPSKPYNWLWDVEWVGDKALGFLYNPNFYAVSSKDGLTYDVQKEYSFAGFPTEAAITTLDNDRVVVILRINKENSRIGIGDKSLKNIEWHDAGCRVEGPDIINIKGKVYVCGRSFDEKVGVSLYELNKNNYHLRKIMELPAKGDCSYPGMVFVKNRLYISYYTTERNKVSVYVSRIKL